MILPKFFKKGKESHDYIPIKQYSETEISGMFMLPINQVVWFSPSRKLFGIVRQLPKCLSPLSEKAERTSLQIAMGYTNLSYWFPKDMLTQGTASY